MDLLADPARAIDGKMGFVTIEQHTFALSVAAVARTKERIEREDWHTCRGADLLQQIEYGGMGHQVGRLAYPAIDGRADGQHEAGAPLQAAADREAVGAGWRSHQHDTFAKRMKAIDGFLEAGEADLRRGRDRPGVLAVAF